MVNKEITDMIAEYTEESNMVEQEMIDEAVKESAPVIAKYAKEHGMTAAELREVNKTLWFDYPVDSPQRYIGFMCQVEGIYTEEAIDAAAALIE